MRGKAKGWVGVYLPDNFSSNKGRTSKVCGASNQLDVQCRRKYFCRPVSVSSCFTFDKIKINGKNKDY